ncbi:hypothetical protein Tco_1289042 [Tanacetum coccineum]
MEWGLPVDFCCLRRFFVDTEVIAFSYTFFFFANFSARASFFLLIKAAILTVEVVFESHHHPISVLERDAYSFNLETMMLNPIRPQYKYMLKQEELLVVLLMFSYALCLPLVLVSSSL